jgi:hypothetical protein
VLWNLNSYSSPVVCGKVAKKIQNVPLSLLSSICRIHNHNHGCNCTCSRFWLLKIFVYFKIIFKNGKCYLIIHVMANVKMVGYDMEVLVVLLDKEDISN